MSATSVPTAGFHKTVKVITGLHVNDIMMLAMCQVSNFHKLTITNKIMFAEKGFSWKRSPKRATRARRCSGSGPLSPFLTASSTSCEFMQLVVCGSTLRRGTQMPNYLHHCELIKIVWQLTIKIVFKSSCYIITSVFHNCTFWTSAIMKHTNNHIDLSSANAMQQRQSSLMRATVNTELKPPTPFWLLSSGQKRLIRADS